MTEPCILKHQNILRARDGLGILSNLEVWETNTSAKRDHVANEIAGYQWNYSYQCEVQVKPIEVKGDFFLATAVYGYTHSK